LDHLAQNKIRFEKYTKRLPNTKLKMERRDIILKQKVEKLKLIMEVKIIKRKLNVEKIKLKMEVSLFKDCNHIRCIGIPLFYFWCIWEKAIKI
jgi:hypothetical protein